MPKKPPARKTVARPRPAAKRPPAAKRARKERRGVGRPAGGGRDLRAHLLDVAIQRFARDGISVTSLREIARDADVNPALVHYYFGDKPQLLQAVLTERLMPAFGEVRAATLQVGGDDIAGLIAGFVRGMCATVERHPWLPPLWIREVLCEGGALRDLLLESQLSQLPQMLAQRFAEAQKAGHLNPGLDPRLLVTSLIGLTLFPVASAPVWRRLLDADDLDATAMCDHAIALLDRGVGPS